MKKIIFVMLTLTVYLELTAQTLNSSRQDSIPLITDSLLLNIGTKKGNIQWQISSDGSKWIDITGKTGAELKVPSETDAFYRAKLNDGVCFETYSDTAVVNEEALTIFSHVILNTDNTKYAPYEMVSFTSSENIFTQQSFTAKIDNKEIIVGSNENTATFVLPNLSNGFYNLNFNLNKKNYIVPITVTSLSNILSAEQYFNDIQSIITSNISDLNSQITQLEQNSTIPNEYSALKSDITKYNNLINNYTTAYNNLSDADKLEFAKTMAANKAYLDSYESLSSDLNSKTNALKAFQSVEDYERSVEVSKGRFLFSLSYTVGHIPFIMEGGKVAAASSGNPGVLLALGVVVTSFMINVIDVATKAQNLTIESIKPSEFITESGQEVFQSVKETVISVRAKYRSLINSDSNDNSNGSTINTIVEKYNYFKDKYYGFVNELPEIFRPSYIMTPLKNTYTTTARYIYNQYVSISNISNPNVTLQKLNQPDGSIKLKATNKANYDQTFSYNVNYTNNNFTKGLTKTVSAKVLAVTDSTEIYRAACVGWWTVKGYDPNNPTKTYTLELFENGTGTYHIPDNPTTYRTSWNIKKSGNEYRLYESGFWHFAYDNLKRDKLTYPLTIFKTYGNFDPNFVSQEYIKN